MESLSGGVIRKGLFLRGAHSSLPVRGVGLRLRSSFNVLVTLQLWRKSMSLSSRWELKNLKVLRKLDF